MSVEACDETQKRAIFFVFDGGTGVGHLRRLACIARKLQGRFSCLIVTGHRAAAHWLVPEECEYIHLPSWDSLLASRASYWGRKPFITLDETAAVQFRKDILKGVVEAFEPDVIFVDHLPLGSREELADIIERTRCLKYLVTRGILNETEDLRRLILGGRANEYFKSYYHRAFVALDRRVFDYAKQYNISDEMQEKIVHVGYVTDSVPQDIINKTREDRFLKSGETWVVASAGGGQLGETLIEGCLGLARAHKDIAFDIVLGPRSSLPWERRHGTTIVRDNLHLHKEVPHMSYLNASADLVISSGGYNSLLETLQGNAKILCFPLRKHERDEQYHHAARLKNFVDIETSIDISRLPIMFEQAIASIGPHKRFDRREELNFGGAAHIEKIVLEDMRHRKCLKSANVGAGPRC